MNMGEKINYLRTKNNMTLEELGNKVGVGKSTVRKWENGMIANMKRDKIAKLAEALDTTPAYLMGWQEESAPTILEETYTDREKNHIKKYRALKEESKNTIDRITDLFYTSEQPVKNTDTLEESVTYHINEKVYTKSIPLYPKLAAAGTGQYLFDDIPSETILVDSKKYKSASYAIGVNGDSMEPTFSDGDILIVDRDSVPEVGKIGIFLIDGKSFVKRLGENELISDNPSYFPIKASLGLCLGCVLGKVNKRENLYNL